MKIWILLLQLLSFYHNSTAKPSNEETNWYRSSGLRNDWEKSNSCEKSIFVTLETNATGNGPYRIHKDKYQKFELKDKDKHDSQSLFKNLEYNWYKSEDWQYAIWKSPSNHWILGHIDWLNTEKGWMYLSDAESSVPTCIESAKGLWRYWIESIQEWKTAKDNQVMICCKTCQKSCIELKRND